MKKNQSSIIAILFITIVILFLFGSLMPLWTSNAEAPLAEFSTKRALKQVKKISEKPHYVSSQNHDEVANYLQEELQKMGLETNIQEGYAFSDWGTLTYCKNIIARIKGSQSGKALLLLSHYDSAPCSYSKGASDAGSGVATILESVRAFTYSKKAHKNDIIILFTDAEELGLNGAALFVTKHKWAKEVGLVLNFEARGSSGPSYMLMETNQGNAGLVNAFAEANTTHPVSNSLMYSIYKMLPNDTDLTVFRKEGNIQGYNFAFIDGHYNYHTAQDDINHLDTNTLAHQGEYLMPLLNYFSNANLSQTESTDNKVYFTIPFTFISYPFDWVLPMAVVGLAVLLLLIFIGIAKKLLIPKEMLRGFIPLFASLVTAGIFTYLGWKALLIIYPQYNDLLNGFTYNGHDYIAAFVALSSAICFWFYNIFSIKKLTMNHYVAPLFLWILINIAIAVFLEGAGFLIIPAYTGLIMIAIFVMTQKSKWILNLLLSIPALFLIAPFVQMFPIGLGLKILFGSALLTVFLFALLLPVVGSFEHKGKLALILLLLSIGFFAKAHYYSGYELGKAKSNSLVYFLDADKNKAYWGTYDKNLDDWTKFHLGENPKEAQELNTINLTSKYDSGFSFMADAPLKNLTKSSVEFLKDSVVGSNRYLKIRITPNRSVNRYDVLANENLDIQHFKANGLTHLGQKTAKYERKGQLVICYYVVNQLPLVMEFSVPAKSVLDMNLIESSFDLLTNPQFTIAKRTSWMMPTPFVLTDAVLIKQKIKLSERIVIAKDTTTISNPILQIAKDSLKAN